MQRRIFPTKPYGYWLCILAPFQISGCETLGFPHEGQDIRHFRVATPNFSRKALWSMALQHCTIFKIAGAKLWGSARMTGHQSFLSWNAKFSPQSLMETGFVALRFFKLAGAKLGVSARRRGHSPFSSCNADFSPQSLMDTGFADLRFFKLAGAKLGGSA